METSKHKSTMADFRENLKTQDAGNAQFPPDMRSLLKPLASKSDVDSSASTSVQQPQDSSSTSVPTTSIAPALVPAAAVPLPASELPAVSVDEELATSPSKRPLAHFGQAAPVIKSKANRKLVLQLTPEQYQYFAHVATLPALQGIALPDLALAILQAWRDDYRPEIKKANAAFKA